MSDIGNTRCIECGGAADQLNEDEDGAPCPACAERLIETLPGIFHAPWSDDEPEASEDGDAAEAAAEDARSERSSAERGSSDEGSAGRGEDADSTGPRRVD